MDFAILVMPHSVTHHYKTAGKTYSKKNISKDKFKLVYKMNDFFIMYIFMYIYIQ